MKKLGLLGRNISYSFSRNYFATKFTKEELANEYSYNNFDIQEINEFPKVLENNKELIGINVTIPYKEEVIPFLDELSENASAIGAINTIKITSDGKLIGHNTDYFGFIESLQPLLKPHHNKALILGTGGAAKAVIFALEKLGIKHQSVSRNRSNTLLSYQDLDEKTLKDHLLIVNCTPLGTFPNVDQCPEIPYEFITREHIAYDLIYNPEKTTFLAKSELNGATIKNGYDMLVLQAEKAWKIWNE